MGTNSVSSIPFPSILCSKFVHRIALQHKPKTARFGELENFRVKWLVGGR